MNPLEVVIYAILLAGGLILAWQFAKNGWLEVGIQQPANLTAMGALVMGMVAMIIAGLVQREGYLELALFTEKNTVKAGLIFSGIPLLFFIVSRYVLLPKGVSEFNRAKIRTVYWTMTNYRPGVVLESGKDLANFPRVQNTLKLFEKAIAAQKQGTAGLITKTVEIDPDRANYDGTSLARCPNCGMETKVPVYYSDQGQGFCSMCGCGLGYKIHDNQIYLTAFGPGVRTVTVRNKENIAVAYAEMALLLRMMNSFDKAGEALKRASEYNDMILDDDPSSKKYLADKGLIVFRQGELAHAMNNLPEAKRLYQESLDIDGMVGNHADDELMKRLIGEVS